MLKTMIIQILPMDRGYTIRKGDSPYIVIPYEKLEKGLEDHLYEFNGVVLDCFCPFASEEQREMIEERLLKLGNFIRYLNNENIPYILYQDQAIKRYIQELEGSEETVTTLDQIIVSMPYFYFSCVEEEFKFTYYYQFVMEGERERLKEKRWNTNFSVPYDMIIEDCSGGDLLVSIKEKENEPLVEEKEIKELGKRITSYRSNLSSNYPQLDNIIIYFRNKKMAFPILK